MKHKLIKLLCACRLHYRIFNFLFSSQSSDTHAENTHDGKFVDYGNNIIQAASKKHAAGEENVQQLHLFLLKDQENKKPQAPTQHPVTQ